LFFPKQLKKPYLHFPPFSFLFFSGGLKKKESRTKNEEIHVLKRTWVHKKENDVLLNFFINFVVYNSLRLKYNILENDNLCMYTFDNADNIILKRDEIYSKIDKYRKILIVKMKYSLNE